MTEPVLIVRTFLSILGSYCPKKHRISTKVGRAWCLPRGTKFYIQKPPCSIVKQADLYFFRSLDLKKFCLPELALPGDDFSRKLYHDDDVHGRITLLDTSLLVWHAKTIIF
jgi:hypothetical protein